MIRDEVAILITEAELAVADAAQNIPARKGKSIVLQGLSLTGDDSASLLTILSADFEAKMNSGSAAGQSLVYPQSVSGLEADDKLIVQHQNGDVEYFTAIAVGTSDVMLSGNLAAASVVDKTTLFKLENATKRLIGSSGYLKQNLAMKFPKDKPVRLEFSAGTSVTLYGIEGEYV